MIQSYIEEKMRQLPDNIQDAISRFDWKSEIFNISNKYHLQLDQAEEFQNETLLIIVGLSSASSYGKNLIEKLNISEDLSEKLVSEANELIFRPLQRIAFADEIDEDEEDLLNNSFEDEIIPHDKISSLMEDHGIQLVDDNYIPQPDNDLQKMANELFQEKEVVSLEEEEKLKQIESKPISYREEIEEKDLRGIKQHDIDMSILEKNKNTQGNVDSSYPLEKDLLKETKISKVETFDFSPTKEEQLIENGQYLNHIGGKEIQ